MSRRSQLSGPGLLTAERQPSLAQAGLGAIPESRPQPRVRDRRATYAGLAAAGLLGSTLLLALCAARTPALLPESVRPIPRWLAGPFGTSGAGLSWPALVGALTAMFACYVLVARSADRLSARTLLMIVAGLHALVLLAPPLLSTDVFSYQAYARMGTLYGANPYLHGPSTIALDPLYPYVGADWVSTPTAYGPLFTLLSYALAPLSIAASTLAYKALAVLASLAAVTLVWKAAALRGLEPRHAAALVGLNPLLLVYGVGGAHNDLLMVALMAGGIVLMLRHRERGAGATFVVAAAVKLSAGLLLPFALAGSRLPRVRDRRGTLLTGAGAAMLALGLVSALVFGGGPLHLLGTLTHNQSHGDWHSISGFVTSRMHLHLVGHILAAVLAVVCAVVCLQLLRRVWRGELDWIAGAGWATLVVLVCAGSMLPWYLAWLMPLAALGGDDRLRRWSLVLTGLVLGVHLLAFLPHVL